MDSTQTIDSRVCPHCGRVTYKSTPTFYTTGGTLPAFEKRWLCGNCGASFTEVVNN